MSEHTWFCPDCEWSHSAHAVYGWARHDDRAVEVHRTTLCPSAKRSEVGDDLQVGSAARESHRRMLDPDSGRIDNWTEGSTDR